MRIVNRKSGFTLIELFLVIAIIGISTAIVLPSFVQSMKGNRLRVATRTVVKAGRYARSIAVLKQVPITIVFDLDSGTVSVAGGEGRDNIKRKLDRITIEFVMSSEEDKVTKGSYNVVYQTNGRCKPYTIKMIDSEGVTAEVQVDALATAETVTENE
jgi:type II secretion system protein H